MRGASSPQNSMFSYISLEDRVPASHPLRKLRSLVDVVLGTMSEDFDAVYSRVGRPSVPPERLLKALLLQILFSLRSERLLVESIDCCGSGALAARSSASSSSVPQVPP